MANPERLATSNLPKACAQPLGGAHERSFVPSLPGLGTSKLRLPSTPVLGYRL